MLLLTYTYDYRHVQSSFTIVIFVYYGPLEVKSIFCNFVVRGLLSQDIIFNVTCLWALSARVIHYTRPERLDKDKHSSFLGRHVSYEENEVL
jgi:hypothetical protein